MLLLCWINNIYQLNVVVCFRFQCIQACDYDDTKLVTGENLVRHRTTKFAHLSLKHISLIGVVRLKVKGKKKKKTAAQEFCTGPTSSRAAASFFDDAAAVARVDDDEDDEDDDEEEDDGGDFDGYDQNGEELTRGMSESEFDSDSEDEIQPTQGDVSEMLVAQMEVEEDANADEEDNVTAVRYDHTYSCNKTFAVNAGKRRRKIATTSEWRKKAHYRYSFLYSMVSSGVTKKIRNCISKAVAILSNSKTIILGHVNFLLECLDPRLAQLCYMDTDSCIFSFTHPCLEDNLLPDKKLRWQEGDIIANETGEKSCHGKLKLEGTFRVGLFKALKIYRLFTTSQFREEQKNKTCYTRCKGVNRNIAKVIPNVVFDKDSVDKVVVHRSCLRPSRTGEMLIAHECKSLAAPFNLKRHVHSDGIHTFPISYVADDDDDDDDNDDNNGEVEGPL